MSNGGSKTMTMERIRLLQIPEVSVSGAHMPFKVHFLGLSVLNING